VCDDTKLAGERDGLMNRFGCADALTVNQSSKRLLHVASLLANIHRGTLRFSNDVIWSNSFWVSQGLSITARYLHV
jgi:hypothetical protein